MSVSHRIITSSAAISFSQISAHSSLHQMDPKCNQSTKLWHWFALIDWLMSYDHTQQQHWCKFQAYVKKMMILLNHNSALSSWPGLKNQFCMLCLLWSVYNQHTIHGKTVWLTLRLPAMAPNSVISLLIRILGSWFVDCPTITATFAICTIMVINSPYFLQSIRPTKTFRSPFVSWLDTGRSCVCSSVLFFHCNYHNQNQKQSLFSFKHILNQQQHNTFF
mgnify:CR=1 FL=1